MSDDSFGHSNCDDYRRSHLTKGADYDQALKITGFDAYMARRESELLTRIVPRLFPGKIPRYLDFACGTGRITQTMQPLAEFSVGVDISASMVAEARKKCPGMQFIVCDPTADAPTLEPVDLISSFRFLGNAQPELRRAALRTMHDLLVPGGYLVVNNHRNASSIHNLLLRTRGHGENDGSDLTTRSLKQQLIESGFRLIRIYGIGFWVVRHSLRRQETLNAVWAPWLEKLSTLRGVGSLCPDMVVVAQRL